MIPVAASAALSAVSSLASIFNATSSSSTPTSGTSSSSSSATTNTDPTDSNGTVSQADFMQLLVAQLQNQDPLNPLDSADFAAQLAQFSSLQQLTEINAELKGGTTGGGAGLDAVGFLGKMVEGTSSTISVANGASTALGYTLPAAGDVHAHIVNANGQTVVGDIDLGQQDAGSYTFDLSKIPNAPQLSDGTYTVTLASVDASGKASAVGTIGGGIVTGVDLSGSTPTLLIGSQSIALSDIKEVVEPPSGS